MRVRLLRQSDDVYSRKPEVLMVEVIIEVSAKVLLAVVYRPSHCGFLSEFFDYFGELSTLYRHTIIMGDFNADLISSSFDAGQILTSVGAMQMYLVPYSPTHHTKTSSTLLDLCLIDDQEKSYLLRSARRKLPLGS